MEIIRWQIQFFLNIVISIILIIIYPIFYLYNKWRNRYYEREFNSILITGASSGIGESLVYEFAEKSYCKKLYLISRNLIKLKEVVKKCYMINPNLIINIYDIDVTNRIKMREIIQNIYQNDTLDLIIANAGVTLYTSQKENIEDAIYNLYDVNINGVLNTILPIILEKKEHDKTNKLNKFTTIAIMSSQASHIPLPGINAFYSSSKSAISYLQGLRKLYKDIIIIEPGYIRTRMTEKMDDFPYIKYIMQDLKISCQEIIKQLEQGKMNIIFPKIGSLLISITNLLPPLIRDKLWLYLPNLIMGEKLY